MNSIDFSEFLTSFETPKTRAYDHALDLAYMFISEMEAQGLTKTELAKKMGISKTRLSNLLNTQPNMTLETIAQFELALNARLEFNFVPEYDASLVINQTVSSPDPYVASVDISSLQEAMPNSISLTNEHCHAPAKLKPSDERFGIAA